MDKRKDGKYGASGLIMVPMLFLWFFAVDPPFTTWG